jgi:ATP-dependent RNA helicase RhlE
MKTFEELKITKSLLKALEEIGFTEPTPIQETAIPVINSGMNLVGIAQTGTGKTAAYLLPLLSKLVRAEGTDPRVIVLVPTRELSVQVGQDTAELTSFTTIKHAAVYGGVGWTKHSEQIAPGVDILIATPGRLWDLYAAQAVSFRKVKYLVIDEADRMLDMGFIPQLRKLFEVIPHKRQNLLFSATFSEKIEQMAQEFLDHYERVEVSPSATPAQLINQQVYLTPNYRTKLNLIGHLLSDEIHFNRVILFVKTKEAADDVFRIIRRRTEGEKRIIHSNKGQTTRLNAIRDFKEGNIRILISTDMSARGLDVSMVSHVINFDIPPGYEDYVHRIGRTARAGNHGTAITLVNPDEEWHLKKIEKLIRMSIPVVEIPQEVTIETTGFEEMQIQLREIDRQRKIDDPDFMGAFHTKKPHYFDKPRKTPGKPVRKKRK